MFLRTWRFMTIILAALSTGMSFCHTLELPAKMSYDGALWTTINQSLYQSFGTVGGILELGSIFAAVVLAFLVRQRHLTLQWTLTGTVFLALALVVWLVFVAPMNAEFSQWTVGLLPENWTRVRNQWEYAHATRFVLHFIGLSALVISVLRETPTARSRDRVEQPYAILEGRTRR